ncbi:PIN domain-containing protein [Streptomyces sp. B1866]|uniref:PIN domain-containing protein n=1 Tax=Streptomyces sp. B1866 TaxID=3075431 RepID=UPI00288FEB28|nr:PIN domain-containing protein [Streptomyces sp. B1866]MDT3398878.1 PIN domain-containing protein [Streptomyces sp. B1866]
MIVVVADTSALLAAADADHPDMAASLHVLESAGLVVLSPLILAEADHLMRRVGGPGLRDGFLDSVVSEARRGRFHLPEVTPDILAQARGLMRRYTDLDLDLADAVNVVLASAYRTDAVLTLDRRDFRAIRPLTAHKAFRVLPDDL